ncbi:MAG: alpha/beta hydrolase family protein [Promicromonosporaceae bacterium]|nr:alpha/beta hydrolase family protein [Promicromonosporaceae bacterium]
MSRFIDGAATDLDEADTAAAGAWQGGARLRPVADEADLLTRLAQAIRDSFCPNTGALNLAALFTGLTTIGSQTDLLAGLNAAQIAHLLTEMDSYEAVRALWDTLTPDLRDTLIEGHPEVIGNLDGVPIMYRAQANVLNMRAELGEVEARLKALDLQLKAFEASPINSFGHLEVLRDIAELTAWRDSLNQLLTAPIRRFDRYGNFAYEPGTHVIAFCPNTGSIITYHGPFNAAGDVPDWVVNVGVVVPGTGTNMRGFREGTDQRARNFFLAANEEGGPTAMFAFGGGAFPQSIPFDAPNRDFSVAMGPDLARFVSSVYRPPRQQNLTIIGHSYGSPTVGAALMNGMPATKVIHVASPGLSHKVRGIDCFPPGPNHFAIMAGRDFIQAVPGASGVLNFMSRVTPLPPIIHDPRQRPWEGPIGHGPSTTTGGDITRLRAGDRTVHDDDRPDTVWDPFQAHTYPMDPGSESFDNIIAVITGGTPTLHGPIDIAPGPDWFQPQPQDGRKQV